MKKLVLVAVRYCQFCVAGPGLETCWGASELGFLSLIRVAKSWSLENLGEVAPWGSESSRREGSGSRLSLWRKPESIHVSRKILEGGFRGSQLLYRIAMVVSSLMAFRRSAVARVLIRYFMR